MSTTDTRAAFEAHYREECGMPDNAAFQWDAPYMVAALDGWQAALAWQAATEAAKATGTAGDLPPLPEAHDVYAPHGWLEYYTADQMREYGQACAQAARQPAPVDQPIGPISDWTLPRLYDLACRQRHEIRESDKCIKRYADELVAVRQSSQMPKVKIWQDRFEENYGRNPFDGELVIDERDEEIADLRAALAATAAPVAEIEPCGGCGNSDPDKRCIGCTHPFGQVTPECTFSEDEIYDIERCLRTGVTMGYTKKKGAEKALVIFKAATNRSQP